MVDIPYGTENVGAVLTVAQWADQQKLLRDQLAAQIAHNQASINAEMARISASTAQAGMDAASREAVARLQAEAQERIAQLQAQVDREALALQKLDADRQFGLDTQRFGLEAAKQNWLERTTAIEFEMDKQRFGLETAQFNAQQRQAQTAAKLQTLELLASKSGPQDWVAYNNLLAGTSSPEALARGEVDPFAFIEGQFQEFTPGELPSLLGATGVGQNPGYQPPAGGTPPAIPTSGPGAGGTPPPPVGTQPNPGLQNVPGANDFLDQFNGGNAGKTFYNGGGTGGSLVPQNVEYGDTHPGYQPAPPGPWVGPTTNVAGNTVTSGINPNTGLPWGQAPPAAPPPTNPTGPLGQTNSDGTIVEPTFDTFGYPEGMALPTPGLPNENVPNASWNGTEWVVPMAQGGVTNANTLLVGEQGPELVQQQGSLLKVVPLGQVQTAATGGEFNMQPTGQQAMTSLLQGTGTTAGNQWAQQYGQQPTGTYGAGNPYRFQFAQYDPATLGSQPFIQKLRGETPTNEFGGFGAQLSNPSLGISNMPWALNYKTLLNLNPSEQQQTESLYSQGLGVDFRDVVEQSRRAAPRGTNFGVAGYAGR